VRAAPRFSIDTKYCPLTGAGLVLGCSRLRLTEVVDARMTGESVTHAHATAACPRRALFSDLNLGRVVDSTPGVLMAGPGATGKMHGILLPTFPHPCGTARPPDGRICGSVG
jgi:hypothetical protein